MKGVDDVVTGTDEVLLQPPLQLVIVRVEVVNEVTIIVVPLELRVLVRGQTVVEVKTVMSRVSVMGPAEVVELMAEEVIKLLEEEELTEDEVTKLLVELEVELWTGSTTEDVVVALLP